MAAKRLQILMIVVVVGVVLVLVEADRYRRGDSSQSGSSSERRISRGPRRRNQGNQHGIRNGNPNGARRSGSRESNQKTLGSGRPSTHKQASSARYNKTQGTIKKQSPVKKHGLRGGTTDPGSIQKSNPNPPPPPPSRRRPAPRRNLSMKNHDNNVDSKGKTTPAKPIVNTNGRISQRRNSKRSSESSASVSFTLHRSHGSEPISNISPSPRYPFIVDPTTRSDEASRETQTRRKEDEGKDPDKDDSIEDEIQSEESGEDGKDDDKGTEDDFTTVEDSTVYSIPTETDLFTTVTSLLTLNNTDAGTTIPSDRDVLSPPVPVREKMSLFFCLADRPNGDSKCPCPEKVILPVLPQFPTTECKFRKGNNMAIPIGIEANDERSISNHNRISSFILIVALLIVPLFIA